MADHVVRWTMTATHAELLRVLPPELAAGSSIEGRYVRGSVDARRWELELVPAAPLRMGLLDLEVTELVIRLWGYSEAELGFFLDRLAQCTRRGGG